MWIKITLPGIVEYTYIPSHKKTRKEESEFLVHFSYMLKSKEKIIIKKKNFVSHNEKSLKLLYIFIKNRNIEWKVTRNKYHKQFRNFLFNCSSNSSPRQDLSENWILKVEWGKVWERKKKDKDRYGILRVKTTRPVRRLTSSLLYVLKINTKYCWKEYKINCQRHPNLTIKSKLYLSLGSDFPLSFRSTQYKSKSPGFDPMAFWQVLL